MHRPSGTSCVCVPGRRRRRPLRRRRRTPACRRALLLSPMSDVCKAMAVRWLSRCSMSACVASYALRASVFSKWYVPLLTQAATLAAGGTLDEVRARTHTVCRTLCTL